MELVGQLKEQVANAKDKAEVKSIIEQAGMLLSDEELDQVSGGRRVSQNSKSAGSEPFINPVYS